MKLQEWTNLVNIIIINIVNSDNLLVAGRRTNIK